MSKQVKFRRGTTAQHATFTGALGEVTVDTDKDVTVVHNASTAGGFPSAREDRPRGWTRTEIFTANGTWTQTGKTDLRRVRVTAYGGGGGGSSAQNGSGGGAGGVGMVVLEASSLTTNVTVTIGTAGSVGAAGGTTSFGTYISATGGAAGTSNGSVQGGTASGTGVFILGGQGSASGDTESRSYDYSGSWSINHAGRGGGLGGGAPNSAAKGITGSGGGRNAAGSAGCVIIEEIYGIV